MQADSMKEKANRRGYKNVFDALARVFREEGLSKLYSGLYPNILRGMSVNAGMLACFDQAKEFIGENVMHDPSIDQPSLPTQLLASMISGFTASFFSLPFDLLKSRLRKYYRILFYFNSFSLLTFVLKLIFIQRMAIDIVV